jgi:hypothetical protein
VQSQFNFDSSAEARSEDDALKLWRERCQRERLALAKELGLPIGHEAEVWLTGGIRLRGKLQLHEEMLLHASVSPDNTRLLIGRTPFYYKEIDSCVRL